MLTIHSSNRVETLAARLGGLLRKPLADPMAADVIMVQSHGLERWLSLELATTLGVSANIQFPFPIPFLTRVMVANTPGWNEEHSALLDREALQWILMEVLPDVAKQIGGEPLANFLDPEASSPDVRLYQLASRLGELLDRYQLYRPQILQRWLNGRVLDEEIWQALTWQALIRRTGPYHRLALQRAFLQAIAQKKHGDNLSALPPRICLFGLSSLAPFFVDTLNALSPHTDLHLFFLNPCQEYWGDILSRKQRTRIFSRNKSEPLDPLDQMELGLTAEPDFENELLAYFGKLGRDFFDQLVDIETADHDEEFVFAEGRSALAALQTDILSLQEGQGNIDAETESNAPSLQVHSCHSPMREVEVLNDVLLDLFEKQPDLTPRDVIVMAPKIDDYTSKIHAVFGRPHSDERYLPYDIADRTPRLSHTLSGAFLQLLSLADTRWEVSEILGILECVPIMERFGITETGLDTIRHWIAVSGTRWARDGHSKADFDLPETYANTWQFGLDRLLLGYAMPSNEQASFEGVLPFDHVEGSDLEVLSQFLSLWDQLRATADQLKGLHPASRWAQLGRQIVRQFFVDDPAYAYELQFLYQLFDEFEASVQQANFENDLSLAVVRTYVEGRLDESRTSGGFFTGGITFCNLLPMRSIPFRVVVLLGMNSKEFPRQDRQDTFDLMSNNPVRGDRTRKQDDRYMFLEAMLAARDHFVMLYTGQSLKDNSEMSPSVFVNQLRDYFERVYQIAPSTYSTTHPLQPFSPTYFDPDQRFRTFAREYLESTPSRIEAPELQTDEPTEKIVTIGELIHFLQQPVATYYQHVFGLYKPSSGIETSDVEPITLNALDSWQLDQWILELLEAETPIDEIGDLLLAGGQLPHGAHGRSEVHHVVANVRRFQKSMQEFLASPLVDPIEVDLMVGEWRVRGTLNGLREEGFRRIRFGKIRPKDRYRLWVEHLVAQSLPNLQQKPTIILGRDDQNMALQEFNTTHAAVHELRQLAEIREEALTKPLALFPRASMTYAEQRKKRKDPAESLAKARDDWQGNQHQTGERDDYYHQLAFGTTGNPFDKTFTALSEQIVRPILDNEKKNVEF